VNRPPAAPLFRHMAVTNGFRQQRASSKVRDPCPRKASWATS